MDTGVAQDQIAAFVDRILRLKEEAKALNQDIREIYAEAKGQGFDKTVLGKLVNYVEKRADKPNELAEGEAIFDLYLTAYDSAKGRVGTRRATHTHEASNATAELVGTVAAAMQTDIGRKALTTALDVMIEREEEATEPQVAPQPAQSPMPGIAENALTGQNEALSTEQGGDESSVTHSPETANEKPNEGAKRLDGFGSVQDGLKMSTNGYAAGEQSICPESNAGVQGVTAGRGPQPINPRCQKAAQGDPCQFSHKIYSCSPCNNAWMASRQKVPA